MRFIKWFFVLTTVLFLSACTEDTTLKHDTVFNELRLVYALNDNEFSVKEDVYLPENTYEDTTFLWTSSNSSVANIVDNKVVITRGNEDITVSIMLKLTIDGKTEAKSYTFTVIKKEEITLKTYNVYVIDGSEATLYQVTENEFLTLEEPTKTGYEFDGFYTDSTYETLWDQSAITKTTTIYIKWTEIIIIDEVAPIINGYKDLSLTVGEIVDYSLGVTIYDELGEVITLEVDDSQIDLTTPGVYDLHYLAVDASGNETKVTVKVTVVEMVQTISFTETFESVSGSSSSYADGQINSQGITWVYVGMRNDQELDGKAITFGANASNHLKAQMTGGIDTFKVDLAPAFSGSNSRQIDLYINNTLKHSFYVTSTQTTYEVSNLGITGDYLLELRNTGGYRVTVDNIQISNQPTSPDLNTINLDIKAFNLPTNILKETQIPLYQTGLNGSSITYTYSDLTDPNNSLIDLTTGLVTMPIGNQVTVEIEVTFTKGIESKTITKSLLIGEGNPITVLQARNQIGYVKLQATLTGYLVEDTQIRAFFEDQTSAIEVLLDQTELSSLSIGYQYILKGDITLSTYKVLSNVTSIEKGIYQPINPTSVTASTAGLNQSRYIYLTGLVKKDYTTGSLEVVTANGSIHILNKTTSDLFLNAKLGQEVSLNGVVYYDGQSAEILILNALEFELRAFNETVLSDKILTQLGLTDGMTITNSIILLNTDPLFELSVSYTSSHPTILSNTGQVITPEVDTLVTLTYVIKQGLTTILTGSIQLDILSTPALTPYYQSAQGLTGGALLAELTKIISRNYNGISYSATNKVLEIADKHPSGNGYLGIYDHVSITSYNKEHVWPQSSFSKASPYKSDMHHLRISNVSTNETRSNYYFNNPTSPTSDWQVGSSRFFPGDLDKGDIARMLMYMAVRYRNDNFRLIIAESGRTSEGKSRTMGNLAVLYDWHISDPVDAFEENRNDVIFGTQNNRNPFIDHPELFHDVWSYFMAENEAPQSLSIDDNGYLNTFQTPSFTNLSTQLG
jgi:endonuclease I